MMEPIGPDEVLSLKRQVKLEKAQKIPHFVIGIFNAEIAKNFNSNLNCAEVKQTTVYKQIQAYIEAHSELGDVDAYHQGWLDVEPLFENAGWKVQYHKQPYYETESSYFIFKKEN